MLLQIHYLSRHGKDTLGHILDVRGCESSHGDPTIVGEVNVRVFAYLEHLASRDSNVDNTSTRSVTGRNERERGREVIWDDNDTVNNSALLTEAFPSHPFSTIRFGRRRLGFGSSQTDFRRDSGCWPASRNRATLPQDARARILSSSYTDRGVHELLSKQQPSETLRTCFGSGKMPRGRFHDVLFAPVPSLAFVTVSVTGYLQNDVRG